MKKTLIILIILIILIASGLYLNTKKPLFQKNNQDYTQNNDTSIPSKKDIYGEWVWKSSIDVAKKEILPEDSSKFVLNLSPEGKLTSTTDCNFVTGSFVKNDEFLSFGTLSATEMACVGNTLEAFYLSQLAIVSSYNISGDNLVLNLAKDSGTMVFLKKEI